MLFVFDLAKLISIYFKKKLGENTVFIFVFTELHMHSFNFIIRKIIYKHLLRKENKCIEFRYY